jgi:hypothetical protein
MDNTKLNGRRDSEGGRECVSEGSPKTNSEQCGKGNEKKAIGC